MMRSLVAWARRNKAPLTLATIHLALAAAYSASFPVLESSDEAAHYYFARHIALNRSLPDVRFEEGFYAQEATQGPLYYSVAAIPLAFIETSDADSFVEQTNPQVNLGDASRPGNKNLYLHDPLRESFPWRGTALAVHIARFVSGMFGALGVFFIYKLTAQLNNRAAVVAALIAALLPQLIWTSASVTNESASAAMAALTIWLMLKTRRQWDSKHLFATGVAAGLATLAKLPGLFLAMYVVAWAAVSGSLWTGARRAGVVGLGFATTAGAWLIMNVVRYGDPTALSAHLVVMGNAKTNLLSFESLRQTLESGVLRDAPGNTIAIVSSFWGVFGGHNIIAPPWVYQPLNMLALLSFVAFAVNVALHRSQPDMAERLWLVGWFAIQFSLLLLWANRSGGVAGRLLFPALPVIAFICAEGWQALSAWASDIAGKLSSPVQLLGRALLPFSLGTFAAFAPAWLIIPSYAAPKAVSTLPPTATPLSIHYGAVELVGIESSSRNQPGDNLDVIFYWRIAHPNADSYLIFPRLLDGTLTPVAGTNAFPGWGNFPVTVWQPNVIYADRYAFPVDSGAARPSLGRLVLSVEANRVIQPPTTADSSPLDPIYPLTHVALPAAQSPSDARRQPQATFADSIALLKSDVVFAAGADHIAIVLTWRAEKSGLAGYTRFIHLDDGNRVAPKLFSQWDGAPALGYGTDFWQRGEVVTETVMLPLPGDLPSGVYAVWIGFTDSNGSRLSITGGDTADGRLLIDNVTISGK